MLTRIFRPELWWSIAHQALRSSRGAAVAVARIDRMRGNVIFAGLGNVGGANLRAARATSQHLVSVNGTAGHSTAHIREFSYPWPDDGILVMHSDGLLTDTSLDTHPGLALRDPSSDRRRALSGFFAAARRCHGRGREGRVIRMSLPILSVDDPSTNTIPSLRGSGRGRSPGCSDSMPQDQTRISTAVSEIARNAFNYAGGGRVEYLVEGRTRAAVVHRPSRRPRTRDSRISMTILEGRYQSQTGMGLGIIGARRLMDQFQIESAPGGGTTSG